MTSRLPSRGQVFCGLPLALVIAGPVGRRLAPLHKLLAEGALTLPRRALLEPYRRVTVLAQH